MADRPLINQVTAEVLVVNDEVSTPSINQVTAEVLIDNSDWDDSNIMELTVYGSKLTSSVTNFPTPVEISGNYPIFTLLPSVDDVKHMRVSTDAAGVNQVPITVNFFDPSAKRFNFHVLLDITAGSDFSLYISYDPIAIPNSSYIRWPFDPDAGVWDSNYKVVYDMSGLKGTLSTECYDSSDPENEGTAVSSYLGTVDSLFGRAGYLDSNGYVYSASNPFDPTQAFTIECLVRACRPRYDSEVGTVAFLLGGTGTGSTLLGFKTFSGRSRFFTSLPGFDLIFDAVVDMVECDWKYAALRFAGGSGGAWSFWLGTELIASGTMTAQAANGLLRLGAADPLGSYLNDYLGDFRISDVVRSDGWLEATEAGLRGELTTVIDYPGMTTTTAPPVSSTTTTTIAPPYSTTTTAPPEYEYSDPTKIWDIDDAVGDNWLDSSTSSDRNYRQRLRAADLSESETGANQVRVKLRSHSSQSSIIGGCSLGKSGSGPDFDSSPVRLTFIGENSVNIPIGSVAFSDWADAEVDDTADLTIAMWAEASPNGYFIYMVPLVSQTNSYKETNGTDATMIQDVVDENYLSQIPYYFIEEVETRVKSIIPITDPPVASYPLDLTIVNPSAESGDTTGWTNETGTLGVRATNPDPMTGKGSYYFTFGDDSEGLASQEITLLDDLVLDSDVDAGDLAVHLKWWQSNYTAGTVPDDPCRIGIRFLNSSKTVLETHWSLLFNHVDRTNMVQVWFDRWTKWPIPVGTRYVELLIHGVRSGGTALNAFIDAIECSIYRFNTEPDQLDIFSPSSLTWATAWNPGNWAESASSYPDAFGGHYLYNYDANDNREWLKVTNTVLSQDFEILCKMQHVSILGSGYAMFLFGRYFVDETGKFAGLASYKYQETDLIYRGDVQSVEGLPVGTSQSGLYIPVGKYQWVRFRVIERQLWTKIWGTDEDEPEAWTQIFNSITGNKIDPFKFPMMKGEFGIGHHDDNSYCYFDYFSRKGNDVFGLEEVSVGEPDIEVYQAPIEVLRRNAVVWSTAFRETGYTVGQAPTDWTSEWGTGNTYTVETASSVFEKRILQGVNTSTGWSALSADAAPNSANVSTLMRIRAGETGAGAGIAIRGSGSTGTETAYIAYLDTPSNQVVIGYLNSGSWTQLGTINVTLDVGTWYWLRLRGNGSWIQAKCWAGGSTDEPSSWGYEVEDTTISASGWVGIGSKDYDVDYDYYAVTTGGENPLVPDLAIQAGVVVYIIT